MQFWKKVYLSTFRSVRAATLVELLVAISITSVVIAALMFFVSGALSQMALLQGRNAMLTPFSQLQETLIDTRSLYPEATILYHQTGALGSDVVMFYRQNSDSSYQGVLMWVVNTEVTNSVRLDKPENAQLYAPKQFAFRRLASSEVMGFLSSDDQSRQQILFGDTATGGIDMSDSQIIEGLYTVGLSTTAYESGAVIESDVAILGQYFPTRAYHLISEIDLDIWRVFLTF